MPLLFGPLIGLAVAGGLVVGYWHRQDRAARIKNDARLKVIEGQVATFRALLRIAVAEHATRRQMQREAFTDPLLYEEAER